MRVVVVGTGVMGLSAARVLAERGHEVLALDRFGVGNLSASSPGPTRIWRLAHTEPAMVRLARRAVAGWRELERRSGRTLLLETGLLWRGTNAPEVLAALEAEDVVSAGVDVAEQERLFPGLRPMADQLVVWQPEAGTVLAAEALRLQALLLDAAGGLLAVGETVHSVRSTPDGVHVASDRAEHVADVAVVAAGPWSASLLADIGVDVELTPVLEQVSYFTGAAPWESMPAVVEGFGSEGAHFYAMPTPGVGYKVGIDRPLRGFDDADLDRTPSPQRVAETEALVASVLPGLEPHALRSEVCSWTSSPDERFVVDRVGNVVVGCGDSGQGFKFLPLFGEVLADLAEGRRVDDDVAGLGLSRFG